MTARLYPALALVLALNLVWGGVASAQQGAPPGQAKHQWLTAGNAGTDPSTNFLGTTAAAALVLRTNGAERLRVLADGRVGVGTSSPAERLHVLGNLRLYGDLHLAPSSASAGAIRQGGSTIVRTLGSNNFFAGQNAGGLTTAASAANTGVDAHALRDNTAGSRNTASGHLALAQNTVGGGNTAGGSEALRQNTSGGTNTAIGAQALMSNTTGHSNTASGFFALGDPTTGSSNTGVGESAGYHNTTGTRNTFVGAQTGVDPALAPGASLANATAVGARARVGASNSLVLGGTGQDAVNVGIGTTKPRSTLQVVGGYVQLPTATGTPPAADCDEDADPAACSCAPAGRRPATPSSCMSAPALAAGPGWPRRC